MGKDSEYRGSRKRKVCMCEWASSKGAGLCRELEDKLGAEHPMFGCFFKLPKASSFRGGVPLRKRWLKHMQVPESKAGLKKEHVIRWTHFPDRCWAFSAAELEEREEMRQKKRPGSCSVRKTLKTYVERADGDDPADLVQLGDANLALPVPSRKPEELRELLERPVRSEDWQDVLPSAPKAGSTSGALCTPRPQSGSDRKRKRESPVAPTSAKPCRAAGHTVEAQQQASTQLEGHAGARRRRPTPPMEGGVPALCAELPTSPFRSGTRSSARNEAKRAKSAKGRLHDASLEHVLAKSERHSLREITNECRRGGATGTAPVDSLLLLASQAENELARPNDEENATANSEVEPAASWRKAALRGPADLGKQHPGDRRVEVARATAPELLHRSALTA